MTAPLCTPAEIADALRTACGDQIQDVRLTEWAEGVRQVKSRQIWVRLERAALRPALRRLIEIDYPHLGVISGGDVGEAVELLYHFFVYHSRRHEEIMVTLAIRLPKADLTVPTITDLIPGALTSEREKQEFLGVQVTDIPDARRMFLPEDFPAGVFPWRKDETGVPPDMVKQLWNTGREAYQERAAARAAAQAAPAAPPAPAEAVPPPAEPTQTGVSA